MLLVESIPPVALGVRRLISCGGSVLRTASGSTEFRPTDIALHQRVTCTLCGSLERLLFGG